MNVHNCESDSWIGWKSGCSPNALTMHQNAFLYTSLLTSIPPLHRQGFGQSRYAVVFSLSTWCSAVSLHSAVGWGSLSPCPGCTRCRTASDDVAFRPCGSTDADVGSAILYAYQAYCVRKAATAKKFFSVTATELRSTRSPTPAVVAC